MRNSCSRTSNDFCPLSAKGRRQLDALSLRQKLYRSFNGRSGGYFSCIAFYRRTKSTDCNFASSDCTCGIYLFGTWNHQLHVQDGNDALSLAHKTFCKNRFVTYSTYFPRKDNRRSTALTHLLADEPYTATCKAPSFKSPFAKQT